MWINKKTNSESIIKKILWKWWKIYLLFQDCSSQLCPDCQFYWNGFRA